ncbi:MAG: gamma-glutamyl-gamma-aminobutyrate hydrolase family protein [Candidatus Pacearchaeota archaeon]|nr:gamma-glutamyl-gamma-aminobutyrate hydrolase family protein [Candidatus Pacearchaeota archaeon]
MILIINICKEELHELEFIKPVLNIVKSGKKKCIVEHYLKIKPKVIEKADKIIICGTSLKDFDYLEGKNKFNFLKKTDKPVLGICAGMQLIALAFGCEVVKGKEIGLTRIKFDKGFLGAGEGDEKEIDVYDLHNMIVKDDKNLRKNFDVFASSLSNTGIVQTVQAIKHKEKEIYGTLFHPEVRQRGIITKFIE